MKVRSLCVVAGMLALSAAQSVWAGTPVEVKLTGLRCIQNYAMDVKADDHVYVVANGVAKGKPVTARVPAEGTLVAANKKQPITDKEATALWKGELEDGEAAVITVTLIQAADSETPGDPAATKKFFADVAAAEGGVAGLKKDKLTANDFKALSADLLKAHQELVTKVKDTLSREKNTEHFGGQFTLVIWNNGGKITKRLDPVGLTFGEHYGTDVKVYTKLKFTRNNVLVKDDGGSFFPQQLQPLSEDKGTIRVKMLETEFQKGKNDRLVRNTTDYLAELQVNGADSKPVTWKLGGEVPGETPLHTYWNFAE